MRESRFEEFLRQCVEPRGGIVIKVGFGGWPDDLVLMPKGRMGFIELKAPGEEPEPLQVARISSLQSRGFVAEWAASFAAIEDFCRRLNQEPKR